MKTYRDISNQSAAPCNGKPDAKVSRCRLIKQTVSQRHAGETNHSIRLSILLHLVKHMQYTNNLPSIMLRENTVYNLHRQSLSAKENYKETTEPKLSILSCAQLADLCTKWRKIVRKVLNLPLQTHCYLLPLLCQCLPVYDEICGRTMNFVRSCLYHQSSVVKSVAWYSVLHGRYSSLIGRNVLLCLQRYKCTFNDFLSCHSFKNIICRFVSASCTDDQYTMCSMLSECLRVRDGLLKLPDCFSQSDINDIILYLSTS